jgi:hypothetical protein
LQLHQAFQNLSEEKIGHTKISWYVTANRQSVVSMLRYISTLHYMFIGIEKYQPLLVFFVIEEFFYLRYLYKAKQLPLLALENSFCMLFYLEFSRGGNFNKDYDRKMVTKVHIYL